MQAVRLPHFPMILYLVAFAIALGGVAHLASRAALGYNNEGNLPCKFSFGGSGFLYVPWRNDPTYPPTGSFDVYYGNARADWNGSATAAIFQYQDGTAHYMAAEPMGLAGPLGNTMWTCSVFGNTRIGTLTRLNTDRLTTSNYGNSTAVHELGHFIGIRHSWYTAVMNDSRDRNVVIWGTVDDDCGVNDRYPTATYPHTYPCGY